MSEHEQDRIAACFDRCRSQGRAALIGYLTAGDPDPDTSRGLFSALAEQVDVLEIGMPFSDPMADGPVIQAASERALAAGTHMSDVFAIARHVRNEHPQLAIVLMGYANVAYVMGFETFAARAADSGADGVLLVDIPPEESGELDAALHANGLHAIRLLSPTSPLERCRKVAASAGGFIYYVSLTGITGADIADVHGVQQQVEALRRNTALPVCVGFGIKSAEQAAAVAQFADGVVVGSYFVIQVTEHLADTCAMIESLAGAARRMRAAMGKAGGY